MDSGERPVTISLVTPSYNQGRYLAATIESVLSQEGYFFLDYLIIDGASSDDSIETVKRYERLLKEGEWPVKCGGIRYRWLSEKDKGQTDAIMKGFRMAEGELLAWLNSDDTYLPGGIERAVSRFRSEPRLQLVYGRCYYTDETGAIIGRYPTEPFASQRLATANFICQPAAFFTKKAFWEVGALDPELHFAMDYDLWIRLARGFPVGYLPEFLAEYRLHAQSKTMSHSEALANHAEALELVAKYYHWSPLNRVFGYCQSKVLKRLSPFWAKRRMVTLPAALSLCTVEYLLRNKGARLADLKAVNRGNLRKLFQEWIDINKG